MLYKELKAALQLKKGSKLTLGRNSAPVQGVTEVKQPPGIHYAGQGSHKYNPKQVRTRGKVKMRKREN